MCLAIPAQIIEQPSSNTAIVNVGGTTKTIDTTLVDNLKPGDFVIVHVGYALTQLDEAEAEKTLALLEELAS